MLELRGDNGERDCASVGLVPKAREYKSSSDAPKKGIHPPKKRSGRLPLEEVTLYLVPYGIHFPRLAATLVILEGTSYPRITERSLRWPQVARSAASD